MLYMPLKPIKRGIEIWAMSDAGMYQSLMYTQGERVIVWKNLEANIGIHTDISTSNTFFASIDLLIDPLKQGPYGCGTVRINRRNSQNKQKKQSE